MTDYKASLIKSIKDLSATIGICGLGYVGLPLMSRFSEQGFQVIGIDIDQIKVNQLNEGKSYIRHIPADVIKDAQEKGFKATTDFSIIKEVDVIIFCVPTPLNKHREPDLSYIRSTLSSALPFLQKGQAISLESTTYPGTSEEVILPELQKASFEVGKDFFLIYSPEREDPGNEQFKTKDIPKICSGFSAQCREVGTVLYESVVNRVIPVSSLKVAEMTKLLENIHRAVNIGLVNELKTVADKMGVSIHEVIDAAATKPFGFTPYYPGPGLGGHCIPIDPFYLTWKAREYGLNTRFIELAGEVNTKMPEWVINKTIDALNHEGKALNGSRILVLGIAYKKNVDDMRESPSVELIKMLDDKGAVVQYSDPYIPQFPKLRKHCYDLSSINLSPEVINSFDCLLLATDHDDFDYEFIQRHAKLIVDTRGRYKTPHKNVIKA